MRPACVLAIVLWTCLAQAAPAQGQNEEPAIPPGAAPGDAPGDKTEEPPPPDALALAREGRRLLKAKEIAAAAAKLKEAVENNGL